MVLRLLRRGVCPAGGGAGRRDHGASAGAVSPVRRAADPAAGPLSHLRRGLAAAGGEGVREVPPAQSGELRLFARRFAPAALADLDDLLEGSGLETFT